jgi:hypothetical protein
MSLTAMTTQHSGGGGRSNVAIVAIVAIASLLGLAVVVGGFVTVSGFMTGRLGPSASPSATATVHLEQTAPAAPVVRAAPRPAVKDADWQRDVVRSHPAGHAQCPPKIDHTAPNPCAEKK